MQCPAREAVCHKCSKKGHFKSVCRSKTTIGDVTELEDEIAFLDTVTAKGKGQPWTVNLYLNNCLREFKIDTGADVTVVPEKEYEKSRDGPLIPPDRTLCGPGRHTLKVHGKFEGRLRYGNTERREQIYVVQGLHRPLLGRPAIESLHLVVQVEPVLAQKDAVVLKFPHLFQGLGCMKGAYNITLNEGAKPFALTTPRRVALPLLPKVRKELQRMEDLGVISKVEGPTDWCVGMVVVPKPDGRVRICVDLTKLNQSVCRERHILPSVEQILAQLGGATVFSKLDANSGFWQIELTRDSALLTTFITPFGRFCFHRLPFGITSAPELFQRRMSEILQGLDGVVCLIDDILVYGKNQEEHDTHLTAVMERIGAAGLTLNREKCEFAQRKIKFLGQVLGEEGIQPDPNKIAAIQKMREPQNISDLRRFLGMVNQLSKFSPQLAEKTKPLRDLLSTKNQWLWAIG